MEKTNSSDLVINNYIEHTLLKQDATLAQVEQLCAEAKEHGFYGVVVAPYFVEHAKKFIGKGKTKVITVVGFPFGYTNTSAKVEEAKRAIEKGADEIDMVMNLSALRSGDLNYVKNDIDSVSTIARLQGKVVKVIIEAGVLSDEEIVKACAMCVEAGADFVKTSTGYASQGATVANVQLIKSSLPDKIKIKASGGIRDREFALQLIEAGASRIGSSYSIQLMA